MGKKGKREKSKKTSKKKWKIKSSCLCSFCLLHPHHQASAKHYGPPQVKLPVATFAENAECFPAIESEYTKPIKPSPPLWKNPERVSNNIIQYYSIPKLPFPSSE